MALKLTPAHEQAMREHAERDYPGECCGVLIGRQTAADKVIESVAPLTNIHEDGVARRFRIDPLQVYRLEKEARSHGNAVVGFYHSHPDHPAIPSEYDREHAWPVYSYVILSVREGRAQDMKSWELLQDHTGYQLEEIETA